MMNKYLRHSKNRGLQKSLNHIEHYRNQGAEQPGFLRHFEL